ncbi:hypothetical protein GLS40_03790 [Pseudooceanicola sp. 216_PA32_1]|uniref:Uncharacterized protein n=1 Tax=Pseudooceanicola pacificus TaxID=2676438 RepID=A0A844WE11_9RHOB|nr:hypothetical protein [Pseudooceanicola pacificus]MWB77139.1 hypothetical protein [Pseudooceanicola pacificus]
MIRIELNTEEMTRAPARVAAALTDMTPLMQDFGDCRVTDKLTVEAGRDIKTPEEARRRQLQQVMPTQSGWVLSGGNQSVVLKTRGLPAKRRPIGTDWTSGHTRGVTLCKTGLKRNLRGTQRRLSDRNPGR